eukprot:Selendium_serpulae@DN5988_c0_g1_i2.p2
MRARNTPIIFLCLASCFFAAVNAQAAGVAHHGLAANGQYQLPVGPFTPGPFRAAGDAAYSQLGYYSAPQTSAIAYNQCPRFCTPTVNCGAQCPSRLNPCPANCIPGTNCDVTCASVPEPCPISCIPGYNCDAGCPDATNPCPADCVRGIECSVACPS